jgi:hypothetical protein
MLNFAMVTPGYFSEITEALRLESPLHAENVDPCGDPYAIDARFFLSDDETAAFAVTDDGEVKYVWSTRRGQGDAIMAAAVAEGAEHLNCFEGHLSSLYARHGFVITERIPNWDPQGPDVVIMRRDAAARLAS